MRFISLPSGQNIPALGMGTWCMGESDRTRQAEISALNHGISLGLTLIDTAEMYGEGGAEQVVAEAIAHCRSSVFLVSKIYPHNATRQGTIAACERSLRRLKTDYLDLYLLHWRGSLPLSETLDALQQLKTAGKIRDFGVSNFDTSDLIEAVAWPHGKAIAVNQVLYNLSRRGIEWDLLPWCRQHQIPVMAYSPVEQGRLLRHPKLQALALARSITPAQMAIAWLLHQEQVIVIPKAAQPAHLDQNIAALDLSLTVEELTLLDQVFAPPTRRIPLQML